MTLVIQEAKNINLLQKSFDGAPRQQLTTLSSLYSTIEELLNKPSPVLNCIKKQRKSPVSSLKRAVSTRAIMWLLFTPLVLTSSRLFTVVYTSASFLWPSGLLIPKIFKQRFQQSEWLWMCQSQPLSYPQRKSLNFSNPRKPQTSWTSSPGHPPLTQMNFQKRNYRGFTGPQQLS